MGIFTEWVQQKMLNEATLVKKVFGKGVQVTPMGVHVGIVTSDGQKSGYTSPLKKIQAMNFKDEQSGLSVYEAQTQSGSIYQLLMPDEVARQVLSAFFDWKKKQGPVQGQPAPDGQPAPAMGQTMPNASPAMKRTA